MADAALKACHGAAYATRARTRNGRGKRASVEYEGDLPKLKRLPKGAIDKHDPGYGSTLLYTASRFGHIDCVRWLIAQGAEIDRENEAENASTPLHGAAFGGHLAIVN
eukprot:gene4099-18219_t